jgi:poly-gamma-glutamate synthesis protein (capsule biosynthesis protein)
MPVASPLTCDAPVETGAIGPGATDTGATDTGATELLPIEAAPVSTGGGGPTPGPEATSRRVRRNRFLWTLALLAVILLVGWALAPGGSSPPTHHPAAVRAPRPVPVKGSPLDPDWEGDGHAVTLAFGGDVNFPSGTTLGDRLAADPQTALGPGVPALLSGVDLSMVNLETALTDGTCPQPQAKQYVFDAPSSALTALRAAGVSLTTEANNHGEDCGQGGLQMALAARQQAGYTVLGIGQNAAQAFTPYRVTLHGQRVTIIAATQVIDADLQTAWTATASQPGLASAYDVHDLVSTVEAARKVSDTVIVFLHWGTELDACPNPQQEPLANVLVRAGADIVVGSHAHVLLGGGYLGSAYVDYGLGNFAFYNAPPPTDQSGSLVVTVTGRHVDAASWRPALIEDELPQPLTGSAATTALQAWTAARSCTDATATPGPSVATPASEGAPAPAAVAASLSVDS